MSALKKIVSVILTVIVAAGGILSVTAEASNTVNRMYTAKYRLVRDMFMADEETMKAAKDFGRYVVFISVSDGSNKAKVFLAQSYTLATALDKSYTKAKGSGIVPKWLKLDIVVSDEEITYSDFKNEYTEKRVGSLRQGIAFTSYYGTAMLEAQINSGGMLDYNNGKLDLKKVNAELKSMGKAQLTAIPKTFRLFRTQGYFAENTARAYKLVNGDYNETGRRELDANRETAEMLADKSSAYLASICDKSGKFVYGYYPIDNEEIEGYNILRHAGTAWNLVMQYEMCGDETLVPVIKSALGFLKKNIVFKDKKTAFVKEGSVLNVGGIGLALLAYTTYEEVFCTGEYNSLIRALANGIMFMQKKDGSYVHTINAKTFKTATDYIIVYYDGEAAYGMLKAYGVLGDKKMLESSCKAADYFIDNDYEVLHSHWMAYVFNEITKYAPEERYFEFGLKNVDFDDYSKDVTRSKSGLNSASETMNAAFEMYVRMVKGGYTCAYLDNFRAEQLVKAVVQRAKYGLNYFMLPEYAMYFKAPQNVVGSFAVREDYFRIRIDDVQHFMDGYYLFWKNYDLIMQYKEELKGTDKAKAEAAAASEEEDGESTGDGEETGEEDDEDTGDDDDVNLPEDDTE